MKRFTDMYKKNNSSGLSFNTIITKAFRKAETLSAEMIEAIEYKKFEQRYLVSEEIIRLMVELHDTFSPNVMEGIDISMQRYCKGNINLITKINLKNDKDLAITLKQSFIEVGKMWQSYKPPADVTPSLS
jgi:hypothetical protein